MRVPNCKIAQHPADAKDNDTKNAPFKTPRPPPPTQPVRRRGGFIDGGEKWIVQQPIFQELTHNKYWRKNDPNPSCNNVQSKTRNRLRLDIQKRTTSPPNRKSPRNQQRTTSRIPKQKKIRCCNRYDKTKPMTLLSL